MNRTAALVLAGGSGTRLGHVRNKVYLPVGGEPLLAWSLRTLQQSALVDRIVLVIRPSDAEQARLVVDDTPAPGTVCAIVEGGATRHASERAGLEALAPAIDRGTLDLVCVHDAARPFVTHALLRRVLLAARQAGGAIPALPLADRALLRHTGRALPEVVPTADLRRVQTPQAFRARELLQAYRAAAAAGFAGVDTAETVQRFSDLRVRAVEGETANIKVTFVEDLGVVEGLAATWDPGPPH